jgi:hypothetical protein
MTWRVSPHRDGRHLLRMRTIRVSGSAHFLADAPSRTPVFLVEACAVWTVATDWLTKSREVSATDAERLTLDRKRQPASSVKPVGARSPGQLVQIEPE